MRLDEFGELLPRSAVCQWCQIGVHEECEFPEGKDEEGWFTCCCGRQANQEQATSSDPKRSVGGQIETDPTKMKDVVSAGRKRAAQLYPIHPGMVCAWSGLLFAGGGVEPITGCNGNLIFPANSDRAHQGQDPLAGNIHHGPDKSTLSNQESNISLVCLSCHQSWHKLNNRYYSEPRPADGLPWLPNVKWQPMDLDTKASAATLQATAAGRTAQNPRVADPHRRGVVPKEEWITDDTGTGSSASSPEDEQE